MPLLSMLLATFSNIGLIATSGPMRIISCAAFTLASVSVWSVAPSFVARDGVVVSLPLAEGAGLQPLRFSEAKPCMSA